jgi:RhtB (resistance to homoserine/threonine) family protein
MGVVDSQVLVFTLAAAALTLAPGQDTLLVLRNVVRGGRRDGIATSLGICSGLFVHATLSAVGVSMLLLHSALAFRTVKLAGACYLVWLGLQSLRGMLRTQARDAAAIGSASRRPARQSFVEGLLSNVLNPKTALFYLAFLPQFIRATDPVFAKSVLLAGIHWIESILWLSALSLLVDRARRLLLRPSVRRSLDGVCGVMLVAFGVRLALEQE